MTQRAIVTLLVLVSTAGGFSLAHGAATVPLGWTAPGDNGPEGSAFAYEIRYGPSPIDGDTLHWWDGAVALPAPTPRVSGTLESWEVSVPDTDGAVAILLRTVDERGNRSPFSNAVVFEPSAPTARFELEAPKPDPSAPTPTTPILLRYSAPGGAARAEFVRILDASGALVRAIGPLDVGTGRHTAEWDGRSDSGRRVASGIYFAVLSSGSTSRKIHVIR